MPTAGMVITCTLAASPARELLPSPGCRHTVLGTQRPEEKGAARLVEETLPCSGKGVARWRRKYGGAQVGVGVSFRPQTSGRHPFFCWAPPPGGGLPRLHPALGGDTQRIRPICHLRKRQKQPVRGARRQAWCVELGLGFSPCWLPGPHLCARPRRSMVL